MASPLQSGIEQSLFDRLTDEQPRQSHEAPLNAWEGMSALRKGVARDLTNLLNTRISENSIPDEFVQVGQSIAAYGILDYTSSTTDKESIRRSLERCIRTFEPRLARVQIHWVESLSSELKLHYQISAVLRVDLGGEAIVFDAELPFENRHFKVNANR